MKKALNTESCSPVSPILMLLRILMFSPNRKSLKENKSEQTKFIASETGKRKSKGKGKRNEQGKQTSEITRRRSPDT